MKKSLLFAAAALLLGTAVNAQDVYKQTGGERNLEFLFAPLGGSPIGIDGIKYRSFTSATSAWRVAAFAGFNSATDNSLDGETELKDVSSEFTISVRPGIERHFAGTDRLSPYYGAEALVDFRSSNDKSESLIGDDVEEQTTKNGSIGFGLNAIAGVDFYFADNIYLGAELGFGFGFTSEFDTKVENTVEGVDTVETPNGSSLDIGPNVVGAIRLGFLF